MEALMMEAEIMGGEVSNWNDDRLDELNRRVESGFTKVDQRFVRLEGEMKEGFTKVDQRFVRLEGEMKEGFTKVDQRFVRLEGEIKEGFAKVDRRFEQMGERFDKLMLTIMAGGLGLFGTVLIGVVGLILKA
jgi:hypothetical protein